MKDKLEAIIKNAVPAPHNFLSHEDEIGEDVLFALNNSFIPTVKESR